MTLSYYAQRKVFPPDWYSGEVAWTPLAVTGGWWSPTGIHPDQRGSFAELFVPGDVEEVLGKPFHVAQVNMSKSKSGVVRGIHGSTSPNGQSKLISCVEGEIVDVLLDLNPGSPTFGEWDSVTLGPKSGGVVLAGPHVGHAFWVVSTSATVVYAVSSRYDPISEFTVSPLDPALCLPWAAVSDLVISSRDRDAPTLMEWLRQRQKE